MKAAEPKNIAQVVTEAAAQATSPAVAARISLVTPPAVPVPAPATAAPAAKGKGKSKSVSDAKKSAETLQKEIEQKTVALQAKLRELEELKKLSDHRRRFIETLDQLNDFDNKLREVETFETNLCKVSFRAGAYSREDLFSISATPVLIDCVDFLRERIQGKVSEIEAALIR